MIDLYTLTKKEVLRFLRVWKQTLLPPMITVVLYLLIFGTFIGDRIGEVGGVHYINFIFPGLLMMSVIMASYFNTSSSFFGSKFQKNIEELFISPMSYSKILIGFCMGGILRGLIVGVLVFIAGLFFADISIHSYGYMFAFIILSSLLFSLAGLLNGVFAKSFDDISIIPSFIITPLIYLGGVFYSIEVLSPFWQYLSQFNPILYMINGLRFSFIGEAGSDVNILFSIGMILIFIVILTLLCLHLLRRGYGIRN